MTESTPPQWGAPAPGGPAPSETPAPAETPQQPAKKGGSGRLIGIIVAVLILAAIAVFRFVLPALEESRWQEGACLDVSATGSSVVIDPSVVDCGSAEAASRIVAVVANGNLDNFEALCPAETVSALQREGETDLYCLVEN